MHDFVVMQSVNLIYIYIIHVYVSNQNAYLFLLVMALLDKSNLAYLNISKDSNWLDRLLSAGMLKTPIADVIFVGLLCWQNEKINLSQTWQLAPASSVKIWLINMLSSLVECIYIFVIQVILGFFGKTMQIHSSNLFV